MKCHKHYEADAVSQCLDCGKELCPECTNKYSIPLCDSCNLARVQNNKRVLIKNSIITIVAFIIGLNIGGGNGEPVFMTPLRAILFAGVPWGWNFLNKITPNIFLFMPVVGWLIYFEIKFFLSLTIRKIHIYYEINVKFA